MAPGSAAATDPPPVFDFTPSLGFDTPSQDFDARPSAFNNPPTFTPPAPQDFDTPSPDFDSPPPDLNTPPTFTPPVLPTFTPPTASGFDSPPPVFDPVDDPARGSDPGEPAADGADLPTRQSYGFAAAPVATDYAPPAADPAAGPRPADGSGYLWDLAATDVFPVARGDDDTEKDAPGASES